MFAITIVHILPESTASGNHLAGLFILGGFLLQFLLDFISGGIEHGHSHNHSDKKLPVGLLLGLFVHAIVEGVPTSMEHSHEHEILVSAILLHKIPISIVLYIFLKKSDQDIWKIVLALLAFALCAPLGNILGHNISFISENAEYMMGFTAGIFLHVSTSIIFESGADHKLNIKKLGAVVIGFALAFVTLFVH